MRTLCCLAVLAVCSPAPAQQPGTVVTPKNGKFSVRFPGKPTETTKSTKTDLGTLKVYIGTYSQADGATFAASFVELPADAAKPEARDTLFDGAIKGLRKDGNEVSRKEIEIGKDKEKGREVFIERGKQQMRYWVVVRESRLIQIGAIGTGDFIKGKEATAFLESLEFAK